MYPYSSNTLDSFMAAHASAGLALGAVLWHRPLRSHVATALMMVAIAMVVAAPHPEVRALLAAPGAPDRYLVFLRLAALAATAALALSPPRVLALVAAAGTFALFRASSWVKDADWEISALHLAWLGVLVGLHRLALSLRDDPPPEPLGARFATRAFRRDDLAIFLGATLLAALCAVVVLQRQSGTGDEWANTFQADLFAHGRAYGVAPPCERAQQSFWVFFYMGRSFSQYTPGWPLFMAPFQRLGIVWLAGPTMLGIGAVGIARVARRAAAAGIGGEGHGGARVVRIAGVLGAALYALGPSALLNGASRFPHPMVCACLAWAVEAGCILLDGSIARDAREKRLAGVVLGTATALMLAARPGDGASIGPAIFLAFAYGLARRRFGWRAFLAVAIAFAFWAGLTLVILRLQLGQWLKTGYQITELYHPWAKVELKAPEAHEIKHGLPLATGAYMWWPCAPALGVAGLLATRGIGRAAAFMLSVGTLGLAAFTSFTRFGQNPATAYGPRLHLPLVVAMAVGTAILLAPLVEAALGRASHRAALTAAGPAVLALAAIVIGVVRIAPLVYPWFWSDMHKKTAPFRAIAAAHLHHAVVTVKQGETAFDPMDLVQNFATDPNPEVLILHEEGGPSIPCARERYADRTWYHVRGIDEATLSLW